jgi:hypothetical protein
MTTPPIGQKYTVMRDSTRPIVSEEPRLDWTGILLLGLWSVMTVSAVAYLAERLS